MAESAACTRSHCSYFGFSLLKKESIHTISQLRSTPATSIDRICGRKAGFGLSIKDKLKALPEFELDVQEIEDEGEERTTLEFA